MLRNPRQIVWLLVVACTSFAAAGQLGALEQPDGSSPAAARATRHPDLEIAVAYQRPGELPAQAADRARQDLTALGVSEGHARIDRRSGRFETLLLAEPLLPGTPPANRAALERAAWNAFSGYLQARQQQLRINPGELAETGKVTVHGDGEVVQIYAPRRIDGIAVRGSFIGGTINRGNLVLLGTHQWGDVRVSTRPTLSLDDALETVAAHLEPLATDGAWGKSELMLVPMARGRDPQQAEVGRGYAYRLVWVVRLRVAGDLGSWETLVDAHSAELLSHQDVNHYAEVRGGVLPVSNDGVPPDGVEQAGWPVPFDNVTHSGGTDTTDSGGNIPGSVTGTRTSTLSGQFIRMNDNCGAISLSSTGDIDFGTSGGTDCTTPGFGGAGNTHASRTGSHELNRIKEMGRGQLPSNA
ncbi:MAG: hypothetical protein V3T72_03580 [Thermoanaerobaculia bacterium]